MATKRQALAVAARFGFELDERNSGKDPMGFTAIFDHPTHSICGSCRSITCSNYTGFPGQTAAECTWAEAIERMEEEGPLLEKCEDPECEYHNDTEEDF